MGKSRVGLAAVFVAVLFVAACGSDEAPRLMNLKSTQAGPDEFAILPTKPLQAPEDYTALPTPTPGGRNLADPTPNADAVIALGGSARALDRSGISASDKAMVRHVSRYGVAPEIRQVLAAEDLERRKKNPGLLLERLLNVNVYFKAYEDWALDQYSELARIRRAGIRTPAAPPEPAE